MSYLVDTNVFSETLKRRPNARVMGWLRDHEGEVAISTITIAEIRGGIERLPDGKRRDDFEAWLAKICASMRGNILSFNRATAHVWGQMQGRLDARGIQLSAFDSLIAATALRHQLTVATRNERNFEHAGVRIENPFLERGD